MVRFANVFARSARASSEVFSFRICAYFSQNFKFNWVQNFLSNSELLLSCKSVWQFRGYSDLVVSRDVEKDVFSFLKRFFEEIRNLNLSNINRNVSVYCLMSSRFLKWLKTENLISLRSLIPLLVARIWRFSWSDHSFYT